MQPIKGTIDRRAYEIAMIAHLREQLGLGSICVNDSRAYRTLDDYLPLVFAFETMGTDGSLRLAVPADLAECHNDRRTPPIRRMIEVERAAAAGELIDVTRPRAVADLADPTIPVRRCRRNNIELFDIKEFGCAFKKPLAKKLLEVL